MLILFTVLLDMAAIVLVVILLLQHIKTKFEYLLIKYREVIEMLNQIVLVKPSDRDLKDHTHFVIPDNVRDAIISAHESMKG